MPLAGRQSGHGGRTAEILGLPELLYVGGCGPEAEIPLNVLAQSMAARGTAFSKGETVELALGFRVRLYRADRRRSMTMPSRWHWMFKIRYGVQAALVG